MKSIIVIFAILVGGLIVAHRVLEDGTVLKYLDEHPQESLVPSAAYYIGQGYYLFQNLQDATTYFLRVAQRYPDGPLGDDAYFAYLQCLDDMASVNRSELAQGYREYLGKYPHGKHIELAQARLDNYTTSGR
jgi:TolA-binding protein